MDYNRILTQATNLDIVGSKRVVGPGAEEGTGWGRGLKGGWFGLANILLGPKEALGPGWLS